MTQRLESDFPTRCYDSLCWFVSPLLAAAARPPFIRKMLELIGIIENNIIVARVSGEIFIFTSVRYILL